MSRRQDIAIIGGGPAGLVAASVAGQLGLRVTLVEKSAQLGGDCLHTGCVPSKTLLHLAHTAQVTRQGVHDGLLSTMPDIDFGAAIDRVRAVIGQIQQHDDPERFRGYGCKVLFGAARFSGPREIVVEEQVIRARRFLIATGSAPAVPPVTGLEEAGFDTNETIFTRRELPRRLAVLGGGPVGVELAQAFARLGARVTLIEQAGQLLPMNDAAIAIELQRVLEREGVEVRTGASVRAVRRDGDSRQLLFTDGNTLECERILVATGRHPAVQHLGLDVAGVAYDRKGIRVDARQRTSRRHIYAAGDVCGPYPFTHMAEYQAGIALANMVFRFPKKADYRVVPRVVYTDPEVATVGLDSAAADARGIRYDTVEFPVREIDRAITAGIDSGFCRLLIRKGRLVGASLIAPQAGELIHELALAMRVNARTRDITELIHAYPTYAQIHRRTINRRYAHLLQSRRLRLLAWIMNRLLP
jgi:pyruvate/2-oxoglutarate dehydrogenase complex dihydrolipoamide dehydrogenase (E3) component